MRWTEALGYGIIERHLGTETGADAIFQNQFGESVILEVVTGGSFRNLFKKKRIGGRLKDDLRYFPTELLGIVIIGDRIARAILKSMVLRLVYQKNCSIHLIRKYFQFLQGILRKYFQSC